MYGPIEEGDENFRGCVSSYSWQLELWWGWISQRWGDVGSVLKGSDCVPNQFWDFEDASIVGGLSVHSFSFVQPPRFSAVGNYGDVHTLELGVGFINCHV